MAPLTGRARQPWPVWVVELVNLADDQTDALEIIRGLSTLVALVEHVAELRSSHARRIG